jgi:hypothetical protein
MVLHNIQHTTHFSNVGTRSVVSLAINGGRSKRRLFAHIMYLTLYIARVRSSVPELCSGNAFYGLYTFTASTERINHAGSSSTLYFVLTSSLGAHVKFM